MYENANIDIGRDLSNFMDIMMRTPSGSGSRIRIPSGSRIKIRIGDLHQDQGSGFRIKDLHQDQ